jgi:DNA-binding XRE family transcriptional regulator
MYRKTACVIGKMSGISPACIIAFIGYYPFDHETATFGGKIRRYKYEHGLSNEKLATLLEVDEGTVANWERNKWFPLARSLEKVLSIIVTINAAR